MHCLQQQGQQGQQVKLDLRTTENPTPGKGELMERKEMGDVPVGEGEEDGRWRQKTLPPL